jgi:2-keto-4-pentenoate hydratase
VSDPLVERLAANRERHAQIPPPSEKSALSVAEAYAIQDQLRETLMTRGQRVIGWKAGFTNKATQTAFGATDPVCGFLLAEGVFSNGAEVPMARFAQLAVEAEVAFVMREDLAGPRITAPRALTAVEGALPRGLSLKAGDLVMSGSVSILLRPKAGETVRASFTRLGSVAARFV